MNARPSLGSPGLLLLSTLLAACGSDSKGSTGNGATDGGSGGGTAAGGASGDAATGGGTATGGGGAADAGSGGAPGSGGAATGGSSGADAAADSGMIVDGTGGPTDPIHTQDLKWVWVPFADAKCRDGSSTGIYVSGNSASDKLMIFLEGGGACMNAATCAANPATFDPKGWNGRTGVFDRTRTENPVKDWSMVYVPYCTGDVHAGNHPNFDPGGGVGPQQFVGYANLEKFLGRIVPTFPSVTEVLHTGISAGGFGAGATVELVGKKFPSTVDVVLVDDSGPSMSNQYLPACLQKQFREAWNFDATFLKDCGSDCTGTDNFSLEYPIHLARTYPNRRGGIIETQADQVITLFYGFGASGCNVDQTKFAPPMDPATFEAGLLDFRAQMMALFPDGGTPNFGTFYLQGNQHTWLTNNDSVYTGAVGGTKLIDWFTGIVNGTSLTNVGP